MNQNGLDDDEGQTIRQNNYANLIEGQTGGMTQDQKKAYIQKEQVYLQEPTNCILISNMFDPRQVDLNHDPSFFIDIKEQVFDLCSDMGKVDKIRVEENSAGNVWVRFRGTYEQSVRSSQMTKDCLNGKQFDQRPLTANFVSESLFQQKIMER